jgi:hypothetical protein
MLDGPGLLGVAARVLQYLNRFADDCVLQVRWGIAFFDKKLTVLASSLSLVYSFLVEGHERRLLS